MNSYSICVRGKYIGTIIFSPFRHDPSCNHASVASESNDYSIKYHIDNYSNTCEDRISDYSVLEHEAWLLYKTIEEHEKKIGYEVNYYSNTCEERISDYSALEHETWLLYETIEEHEKKFCYEFDYTNETLNGYSPKRVIYNFDVLTLLSVLMLGTLSAIIFLKQNAVYTGVSRQGVHVEMPIIQTGGTRKYLHPAEYRWCLSEAHALRYIHNVLKNSERNSSHYVNKYESRRNNYKERCSGWVAIRRATEYYAHYELLPHYNSIAKEELISFFYE